MAHVMVRGTARSGDREQLWSSLGCGGWILGHAVVAYLMGEVWYMEHVTGRTWYHENIIS